ncbi:hypothetical protein C7455_10230 [Roseicyclus mahoneyensis]|uniref:Uncharacterized protein n=2 Tax=Roseicyclus mahoneyensis TaxID=164332 RepID=A0A316GJX0_9RHOB|nr:hypothetical protein C7455_10230 [Roseicyclus mahoneyensis]
MTSFTPTGIALVLLAFATPAAFAADPDTDAMLIAELACEAPPDPIFALRRLIENERLVLDEPLLADSSTCWPLDPQIEAGTVGFSHICAASEDPGLIAQYPHLFWRGPGTSPGEELTLVSDDSEKALRDWAMAEFAVGNPAYNIMPSHRFEGATEISCNSLTFTY